MNRVAALHRLQELDLALEAAQASLTAVEERLGRDDEVVAVRSEAEHWQARLAALQREQRDVELRAANLRAHIKAVEEKLYGGSVHNPRELSDLQHDSAALGRQLGSEEEEILKLMLQADEVEAALAAARATLAEVEQRWQREQEEMTGQQASLVAELASLQTRRAQEAQAIDAVTLALYAALRERCQGRGVARMERGICQGCRITLPMTVLQKVRSGAELVQCPSCERILYLG